MICEESTVKTSRRIAVVTILLNVAVIGATALQSNEQSQKHAAAARTSTSPKKPPSQGADDQKLRVDAIQPLFLDAVATKQTIHLVGNFPDGTKIRNDTDPLSVVTDEESISTGEIFVNIILTDLKPQKVFLVLELGQDSKSIQLDVSPACPTPHAQATDLSGTLVALGAGRCTLPKTFVAFNALSGELTDQGTEAFCNDSAAAGSAFNVKSTYLSNTDRVHFVVCNKNPFNYTTQLSRDEQVIQNDDLSSFLGVLVPGLGASQAAKTASDAAAQQSTGTSTSKTVNTQSNREYNLQVQKPGVKPPPTKKVTFSIGDPTQQCLNGIITDLQALDDTYANFVHQFLVSESRLQDDDLKCSDRLGEAQTLWRAAKILTLDTTVQNTNQKIASFRSAVDKRIAEASNGPFSSNNLTVQQVASLKAVESGLDTQTCIASKAAQIISTQVEGNVVGPLEAVLGDRHSFVYTTFFGPYQQPTSVNWTLQATKIDKAKNISAGTDIGADPYLQCLSKQNPAQTGNGTGDQSPTPQNGTKGQNPKGNKGKNPQNQTPPTGAKNSESTTWFSAPFSQSDTNLRLQRVGLSFNSKTQEVVQDNTSPQDGSSSAKNKNKSDNGGTTTPGGAQQSAPSAGIQIGSGTYTFGGPRVVVSVGIAAVLLRNREFQNVQASGQTSGTTIEYSTNSLTRMSPLIMAHGRLYKYKGSDNAIWGTLGVTASSNNKGVSPGYFVGVTRSFLNNWIFVTPGLYIGQSQKLTGGYQVGQQLPASFKGSLPIEQNYKAGFGFAISFRVPGTSAPKTKPSTSDSGTNNSSGGKKGAKATN
jgi:hypothetical protein